MKVIAQNGNRYTVEATCGYRWTTKGGLIGLTWVYAIQRGAQVEVVIPAKENVRVGDQLNLLPLVNMNRRAFDPCLVSPP